MKVLNLYAGIGGNRKFWTDVNVTAVENNPDIAKIYQDFFPDDKVIVTDAHQYLLDHYKEFDFIWSSPPCPTHSQMYWLRVLSDSKKTGAHKSEVIYPDMSLYQEVIILNQFFKGKWIVENVVAYYKPLIRPNELGRHWFWGNFYINSFKAAASQIEKGLIKDWQEKTGFDLSNYKNIDKRLLLRNCVLPELGLHIFKSMNNQELKLAL